MNKDLYDDWYADNRENLMSDFMENHLSVSEQEEFEKYCAEEFAKWKDEK